MMLPADTSGGHLASWAGLYFTAVNVMTLQMLFQQVHTRLTRNPESSY